MSQSSGFTLLEVLVSVAIISVLFTMTTPVFAEFLVRNDLDIAVRTYVQAARRAQQLSQGSDNSSGWGVKYAAGQITIFRGATDSAGTITYATRTASADDNIVVPSAVTPSGTTEIDFTYFTGAASNTPGTLTLTDNGKTRTVSFNAKGMIDWQ